MSVRVTNAPLGPTAVCVRVGPGREKERSKKVQRWSLTFAFPRQWRRRLLQQSGGGGGGEGGFPPFSRDLLLLLLFSFPPLLIPLQELRIVPELNEIIKVVSKRKKRKEKQYFRHLVGRSVGRRH